MFFRMPNYQSTRTTPSYDRRNRRSRSRDDRDYKRISQNNSKRDLKNDLVYDSTRYKQDHVTPAKRETSGDLGNGNNHEKRRRLSPRRLASNYYRRRDSVSRRCGRTSIATSSNYRRQCFSSIRRRFLVLVLKL